MPVHSAPLTKPDFRVWFSYFCMPFILVLLSSGVLFVVRKRQGIMDWSQFFGQIQINSWIWLIALVVLILPLLLLFCAQAQLEAKHEPSIKCLFKLLGNSFPLFKRIRVYLFSWRVDLWICAALGVFSALILLNALDYESLFDPKKTPLLDLKANYWLLLYGLLLLPAFGILQLWDSAIAKIKLCTRRKDDNTMDNTSRIQSDAPIVLNDEDLFEWREKVDAFSTAVLKAPDGTAFGVEAPWGTGKTSFINLCELKWQKPHIVYRFELLKYAGNSNLIEQFVLGLLYELEQHHYLPELRGAVQGYLAGLQGALELSGGPLKITLNSQPSSIEDALQRISAQLERRLPETFRLIVVIDDLDRVAPENVRDLLFALHKCFALPRLRYVLCYDQQQLAHKAELHRQHGGDLASQTLHEFLDKFVAARAYLHPTLKGLESYVSNQLLEQLKSQLKLPDKWRGLVEEVLTNGALELLKENDFFVSIAATRTLAAGKSPKFEQSHVYWHLLGNVRQLKWLFNQICLCWQQGLDLSKHEFNARDLVYLLLLQQVFPDLFRRLRAQAQSGEYLALCSQQKPQSTEQEGVNLLDNFINTEKHRYPNNPLAKSAVEILLRGLFDDEIPFSKTIRTSNPDFRARDNSRLPAYFHLILQEKIPALHSSNAYRIWIQMQWKDEEKKLHDLFDEDVFKSHSDSSDNWHDEHEYRLWEVLLGALEHYDGQQQIELLTEYLQALPRFTALSDATPTKRRIAMASLLGESICQLLGSRNLNVDDRARRVKKLLEFVFFNNPNSMLNPMRQPIDALLGWQDAIFVCSAFQIPRLSKSIRDWVQNTFWNAFDSSYPKSDASGQIQLQALAVGLQGSRENIDPQKPPNPREWLVIHWKRLYYLSSLGPDAQLHDASPKAIENFLFDNCWGESKPTDEQLSWWLDYLLYNRLTGSGSGSGAFDEPDQRLNFLLHDYAEQHAEAIEKVRQAHCKTEAEITFLNDVLT